MMKFLLIKKYLIIYIIFIFQKVFELSLSEFINELGYTYYTISSSCLSITSIFHTISYPLLPTVLVTRPILSCTRAVNACFSSILRLSFNFLCLFRLVSVFSFQLAVFNLQLLVRIRFPYTKFSNAFSKSVCIELIPELASGSPQVQVQSKYV